MKGGWARYALERYAMLRRWRELTEFVAKACIDVLGKDCLGTYVVGGVAEDRLTVLSDIDVVIIVRDPRLKCLDTIISIKRRAEELGLPIEAPMDIKVMAEEEFRKLVNKGVYKKFIRIDIG